MLRKLILLAIAAAIVGLGGFWLVTMPATISASALPARTANAENGKLVFNIGGCISCHAAPGQDDSDREKLGGGAPLKSPFGTFYAPNISPHPADGIGRWSEANFVTAVLKGTSPDGSHYFPAFPFGSYQRLTLDDTRDLFAYLKTLPPVAGKVRDHDMPFPFNIRRNVGGWKFLFLDGKPFVPNPAQSAEWNRGAYLVNGAGHCAECHSPRNPLGGIIEAKRFAGGPNVETGGWVPNITQKGIGEWSVDEIAEFFETGFKPDFNTAGGLMGKVIANTGKLSLEDRKAMATYLKSLAPVDDPPKPAAN